MNTSFNVLDKANNSQKKAYVVVKFNYENKEYLIYGIDENDQNKQIFISRLISNSEGKYFIENILPEEKGKLSNIVYNIVIVLPSQKDKDAKILIDEFSAKNLVKLSKDIPEMQNQEYYSSCSVAITSSVLVNNAITFYQVHLESENSSPSKAIPTWTLPAEEQLNVVTPASSIMEANQNLNSNNVNPNISFSNNINQLPDNILNPVPDFNNNASLPNPQAEILTAVNNDPNLSEATGISTIQPNLGKQKKAGFANNKYIIIGTVCILLSIAVVIVAYILIKNK